MVLDLTNKIHGRRKFCFPLLVVVGWLFLILAVANGKSRSKLLFPTIHRSRLENSSWDTTLFVVDCDEGRLDMVLNSILCLANVIGASQAAAAATVLCLHASCCLEAERAGLRTVMDRNQMLTVKGYRSYGKPKSHLDDVQLYREWAYLHLLEQGHSIFRTDADTCLSRDPLLAAVGPNQLGPAADIIVSVQQLPVDGQWSFQWSCGAHDLGMTLNNGVAWLRSKPAVIEFLNYELGLGIALLSSEYDSDGWSQKSFNMAMHSGGLCLAPTDNRISNPTEALNAGLYLYGTTLALDTDKVTFPQLHVAAFGVCSYRNDWNCSKAPLVHANGMVVSLKRQALKEHDSWHLRKDWENVHAMAVGGTAAYLTSIRQVST